VWTDKKLGADGHCDVEPGSAAADREKSGIVRRRRDNNLEKRRKPALPKTAHEVAGDGLTIHFYAFDSGRR
ncbi:hypothetical protein, partial [Pseudomonas sp. RL_35y_Pfl2_P42]|uniref:hypothetical protein n=1 Tax=Pseudomonas sp. RL_35y_Pfl2_P42 TaxID=3088710 RepID=UPI0030DC9299